MKSDEVYRKTKRQIQKEYNDALEEALRKNREYFKTVEKVQNGKIKPPSGLRTEKQIEAWKRGYLRRYAKKTEVIDSMLEEFQKAGIKTRKNVLRMMQQTYGIENKATISSLRAGGILSPKTEKQIQTILDQRMTIFDKGALKSLEQGDIANKRLRREFAQGILRGDDDAKMVKRIQNITGMQERDAMRVLETERTRVIGMSQQSTAEEYYEKTGTMVGFKASGGVATTKEAVEYYTVIKEVLGEQWLTNEYFRIGASRLANNLLSDILGTETKFF